MTFRSQHITDEDYERGMDAFFATLDSFALWRRARPEPADRPAAPTDRTATTRERV